MGFLFFIIASVLWLPLTVINLIVTIFKNIKKHGFVKVIDGYFKQTAVDIDRFGNRNFRTTLNLTLQRKGYKFGNVHETISSALGKNQLNRRLTIFGKVVCWILDKIDKEHCKKSIDEMV